MNYCGNYQSAGGRRKRLENGKLADFDGWLIAISLLSSPIGD
jgi:hypothetical protein